MILNRHLPVHRRAGRRPSAWTMAALAALALTVGASAQQPQPVFRSGTDTVLLSVTATDSRGVLVSGLTRGDFQVFEDGLLQNIDLFASDPQPIALSLLIDSSQSMDRKIEVAKEAAAGFAKHLGRADVAQIIDFNSDTHIRQAFTGDIAQLTTAIYGIQVGGSTSLYNAIYIALDELRRQKPDTDEVRRHAIVLLSDGEDSTSRLTYEDVAEAAKRSEVSIYAIGLHDGEFAKSKTSFNQADFTLRTLSQITGGRAFFIDDVKDLGNIYAQIAAELSNQYVIGYVSRNQKRDGQWRQVAVRTNHPDTVVRTKTGYYAPGKNDR